MISFLVNLLVAVLWLFLATGQPLVTFVTGYVIGFALLWLFSGVLPPDDYVRRVLGFFRFLAVFAWEFLVANLGVTAMALWKPRSEIHPDFLTMSLRGLNKLELLILTHCVTLTPGTTTVEISPDRKVLMFHAIDAVHKKEVRRQIRRLRKSLLGFTR